MRCIATFESMAAAAIDVTMVSRVERRLARTPSA
jgi:hypothetical protein